MLQWCQDSLLRLQRVEITKHCDYSPLSLINGFISHYRFPQTGMKKKAEDSSTAEA